MCDPIEIAYTHRESETVFAKPRTKPSYSVIRKPTDGLLRSMKENDSGERWAAPFVEPAWGAGVLPLFFLPDELDGSN